MIVTVLLSLNLTVMGFVFVAHILLLREITGLKDKLTVQEASHEPTAVVVEHPHNEYTPYPWVTKAIKQSNDWNDPQDRADELAALRERMKLSRHQL